ncbi:MAG: LacI family DNA-binding transcriptional regulator [Eubacteriales bacterium]|nr:LacI family DNA-binding transcriptional regulator [Eubacteriales bacterium]
MTLKEIAAEAGVSISTVSRVINQADKCPASKEVQDRIWEIVRRTGYTPNTSARELKAAASGQSKTLSHSIACLFARIPDAEKDSFFSSLARSIEKEAFRHNYILKYSFSAFDLNNPSVYHLISNNQVDGVAVLGRCDKPLLKFLKQHFRYVAYSGLNVLDAKYDQIICDGYQASISAVSHLRELGHTEIAYIGETQNENRYQGYRDALARFHLPFKQELVSNVMLSTEGGYRGARKLLEAGRRPSAFFCPNDSTAIGAMRAVAEHGLSIPGDISVISIDDIDTAQYLTPMLTTVHIPIEEMGKMTAKTLIDRIEGGHTLPMKICLPYYIANRESCGPCRQRS